MSLTDDQFKVLIEKRDVQHKELIETLLGAREDRDRLIRIEEMVKSNNMLAQQLRVEDGVKIAQADVKASAAHKRVDETNKRIDSVVVIGGLTLVGTLFAFIVLVVKSFFTGG